jgi:hypothetical protein
MIVFAVWCLLLASVLGSTDVPCTPGLCAPTQVHMMLRPDGVGVSMLWQTFATSLTSTVWLGTQSNKYTLMANSTRQQSITGSDTGYNILFDHLVDVPSLPPNTRFYYRLGDATDGVSDEYSFVTGPPPQRKKAAGLQTRVVVFGDLGLANSLPTIQLVSNIIANTSNPVDFVMHVGDISYADDYPSYLYERVWDQWFFNMQGILTQIPYMTCPGNHEYSCEHEGCRDETSGFGTYILRCQSTRTPATRPCGTVGIAATCTGWSRRRRPTTRTRSTRRSLAISSSGSTPISLQPTHRLRAHCDPGLSSLVIVLCIQTFMGTHDNI